MAKIFSISDGCIVYSKTKIFILQKNFTEVQVIEKFDCNSIVNGGHSVTNTQKTELIHCAVSSNGVYIACVLSSKKAIVWDFKSLHKLKEYNVPRFPVALIFNKDCSKLLVADKTGDVYHYCLPGSKKEQSVIKSTIDSDVISKEEAFEPAMGHFSMLLDMLMTSDGKFIVTCDRDEKIRITCYPNMYNIHSYCLGHTAFVSRIIQINGTHHIVSGSGDGTIKLWDYTNGQCVDTFDISKYYEERPLLQEVAENINYLDKVNENIEEIVFKNALYAITNISVWNSNLEHYIAISFFGLLGIHVFVIRKQKIEMKQALVLSTPVHGMCFMEDGFLIASCHSHVPFVAWCQINTTERFHIIESHPIFEFATKNSNHIYDNPIPLLEVKILYKQRYDNMTEYMTKKKQRITGDKSKSVEDTESIKKIKISIDSGNR